SKRNCEQTGAYAFGKFGIKLRVGNDHSARTQFMRVQINRFLVECHQNVQIVGNGTNRFGADPDLVIGVSALDPRGKMTIPVQVVTQPVERCGENPVGALHAFPLLTANFPRQLTDHCYSIPLKISSYDTACDKTATKS